MSPKKDIRKTKKNSSIRKKRCKTTYHCSIDIGTRRLALFVVKLDNLPPTVKPEKKGARKPKHRYRKWYKIPVCTLLDVMAEGETDGNHFTQKSCRELHRVMDSFKKYFKKCSRIYIEMQPISFSPFGKGRGGVPGAQNEGARRLMWSLCSYFVDRERKWGIEYDIRLVSPATKFMGCPAELRKRGAKTAKQKRGDLQKEWVQQMAVKILRAREFNEEADIIEKEGKYDVTDAIMQLVRAEERIDKEVDIYLW